MASLVTEPKLMRLSFLSEGQITGKIGLKMPTSKRLNFLIALTVKYMEDSTLIT